MIVTEECYTICQYHSDIRGIYSGKHRDDTLRIGGGVFLLLDQAINGVILLPSSNLITVPPPVRCRVLKSSPQCRQYTDVDQ